MTYAAYQINHLSNRILISHFRMNFSHNKNLRLIQILSKCRRKLTTMLHRKRSPKVFFNSLPKIRHCLVSMEKILQMDPHHNRSPRH